MKNITVVLLQLIQIVNIKQIIILYLAKSKRKMNGCQCVSRCFFQRGVLEGVFQKAYCREGVEEDALREIRCVFENVPKIFEMVS